MEVKFGLFSCDSHAQLDRDAWTKRLSKEKWGDRIPQIVEVNEDGKTVDRWFVNGKARTEWVCNCPAAMEGGVARGYYPRRWEEVPKIVYDPAERLKALDDDRVDGEVLYPNGPVSNFAFLQADAKEHERNGLLVLHASHDSRQRLSPVLLGPDLQQRDRHGGRRCRHYVHWSRPRCSDAGAGHPAGAAARVRGLV